MAPATAVPDPVCMDNVKHLQWPLVLGLGALALLRPLLNIAGVADHLGRPLVPLLATLVISIIWIAAVGLSRVAQPVLTLVFAGLVYGVLSIVLSAILSPFLTGELQGPVATPFGFGIIAVLIVNAIWGAVTGALALLVQRLRGGQHIESR